MSVDQAAWAAALSALPGMGPATLVRLLRDAPPNAAWEAVRSKAVAPAGRGRGRPPEPPDWAALAAKVDPPEWWSKRGREVGVTWFGAADFPAALVDDPDPPGVLFYRGDLAVVERPCVALVGTRSATPEGCSVAYEMGADLAAAGVCVVSGLARGIDAAAHAGLLSAGPVAGAPVGVAASGVDVPYPRTNRALWQEVCRRGVVLSEALPGRPAQSWRFPARNRIIAGLSQLVVVVESHQSGGSLITAEAALARGIEVRVVPGPVHSPASAGSNQLLYDGPGPVRNARDVLDALGMFLPDKASFGRGASGPGPRPGVDPDEAAVLEAAGRSAVTIGRLVDRTGLTPARVLAALHRLAAAGCARQVGGWWSF